MSRHRAADQGRGYVVQKARQHKDEDEEDDATAPIVRKQRRHFVRDPAFLEVPRQNRKSHQQQEQVRENDPFVLEMGDEATEACAEFETGECHLVDDNGAKSAEGDGKGVMVEQGDAEQGQTEEQEVNRNSKEKNWLDQGNLDAFEKRMISLAASTRRLSRVLRHWPGRGACPW